MTRVAILTATFLANGCRVVRARGGPGLEEE